MPQQAGPGQGAAGARPPSLLEPGGMPSTNGGLLMLGAVIAVALLASRGVADQAVAAGNLSAAAEAYRKAEQKLVSAIIEADKNDVGRNEIARRVDGIYSRQTVLTLLGSADLVQRSATVLEEHGLTGDVRVWQGKRQRLLMELADMDRQRDARLRISQAAVHALAKAGIQAHSGTSASPASHLAAGKLVELRPGTS